MRLQVIAPKGTEALRLRRWQGIAGEDEAMARIRMYRTAGEVLQVARLTLGLPQQIFADRLGIGQPYVSLMERGQAYIDLASANLLAAVLNTAASERGQVAEYRGEQLVAPWPQAQPQGQEVRSA